MGKQILNCIEDRLQIVSCDSVQAMSNMSETVTVSTEQETKAAAATASSGQSPADNNNHHQTVQEEAAQNGTVPKLLLPKAVVRKRLSAPLPLPQHKRNMVDGIMKRLSIGAAAKDEAVFATKVFRKRTHSSGQAHDLNAKIQVIDNQESVPGALPTPIVHGSSSSSVFRSDACDTALLKYNRSRSATPSPGPLCVSDVKMEPEASSSGSASPATSASTTPSKQFPTDIARPFVRTPPLADLFRKPRTVAEKRVFLLQSPIEYKVLDFENTVYHLIRKLDRFNDDDVFRTQVELLMYGTVPMNRNIWKAVLWLNDVCNSYRQWTLDCDGETIKLLGSLGTAPLDEGGVSSRVDLPRSKRVGKTKPPRTVPDDAGKIPKKLKNEAAILEHLQRLEKGHISEDLDFVLGSPFTSPKTLIEKKRTAVLASLPPAPLSAKMRRIKVTEEDSQLGPLEMYDLPPKTFTAEPQVNRPMPAHVASYMQRVAPDKLGKNWLEYSLSVLQPPTAEQKAEGAEEASDPKFHFSVPYKNDQKRILVRRKLASNLKRRELCFDDYEGELAHTYTFPTVARQQLEAEGGVTHPKVFEEVAGILTEMIDSVAIGLAENSFIKNDPDLVYQTEKPVRKLRKGSMAADVVPTSVSDKKRSALCKQLRALNVTIIETAQMVRQGECTKEECKKGCVCESLSRLDGLIFHCTKTECMFGCNCTAEELAIDEQEHLERIREDKNRALAPNEKEFMSTIVLTNSNTILMSNSKDRKRNRTAPKRYYDYCGTPSDDDDRRGGTVNAEQQGKGDKETDFKVYYERKKPAWHPTLEAMRHCYVALPQMAMLSVLEPWCIVHEMYRCFCGNQTLYGQPFRIQSNPDGTIKANIKESLQANSVVGRRRPSVVKDEYQDSLERIGRRISDADEDSCARCIPVDFTSQFIKNRLNAELVNTKARLAVKKSKQARLEELIENCLKATYVQPTSGPPSRRNSVGREERVRVKQEQFMEHAQSKLGLQIAQVFSLDSDGAATDTAESAPVNSESLLAELKRSLLIKLDQILQSCSKTLLERPQMKKVNFVRFRNFKTLLEQLAVFEVWDEQDKAQCIVMGRDEAALLGNFPRGRLVDVLSEEHQFYLSKFISDDSGKLQSSNIYVVVEGSGRNFWYVRGCQYIKEIQDKIRIKSEHTQQLRTYAAQMNSFTSNIVCRNIAHTGLMALNLRVPVVPGCRYLWLKVRPDFSDMGHPRWRGLLSFKHITQALKLAKEQDKTVQLIKGSSLLRPNLFATADQRVIAGPFDKTEACHLCLYQRVDNAVYLRENYEKMLNIARQKSTIGVWLYVPSSQFLRAPQARVSLSNGLTLPNSRTSEQLQQQQQRRRHSEGSGRAAAIPAPPTILPELEIGRVATVKQERPDTPTPEVSLTATTGTQPRRLSLAEQRKSLTAESVPDLGADISTTMSTIHKLIADPTLDTFRVGNTIVQRERKSVTKAQLPNADREPQTEEPTADDNGPDTDDDDVVLVSNGSPCIIDLDEWERVQQELDSELPPEVDEQEMEPVVEEQEEPRGEATEAPVEEMVEDGPVDEILEEEDTVAPSQQFTENIPASGYYTSNIPNLGHIPAKVLGGIATLPLPFRKMPIKISVDCMDRYMMKYITNSVHKLLPKNLRVKWKFVQSYFPTSETVFKLDASKHKDTCLLTQWGLVDVTNFQLKEADIPDPEIFFRCAKAQLTMQVFGELRKITVEELIQESLAAIKKERYAVLKMNREQVTERMRNVELTERLRVLQSDDAEPL